jgi:hypothetical protein
MGLFSTYVRREEKYQVTSCFDVVKVLERLLNFNAIIHQYNLGSMICSFVRCIRIMDEATYSSVYGT